MNLAERIKRRFRQSIGERIKSEHTWKHRFEKLFTEIGLSVYGESHRWKN